MTLELKHITPYLPYELRLAHTESGVVHTMLRVDVFGGVNALNLRIVGEDAVFKPILRPLTSITKEEAYDLISIAVFNQIVDIDDIKNLVLGIENSDVIIRCVYKGSIYNETKFSLYINYDEILFTSSKKEEEGALMTNMSMYQYLFSKHFDVFGLINKGLAIDKTELK